MHHCRGTGATETGVYDMTLPVGSIYRLAYATYFLPKENEWHEAAYHAPGGTYRLYPTASDLPPSNETASSICEPPNARPVPPLHRIAPWDSESPRKNQPLLVRPMETTPVFQTLSGIFLTLPAMAGQSGTASSPDQFPEGLEKPDWRSIPESDATDLASLYGIHLQQLTDYPHLDYEQ